MAVKADEIKHEQVWESLQQRTAKANVVREAVHLLDVCWHDIDVLRRFLRDHNAVIPSLNEKVDAVQVELGIQSDKFEVWLNDERRKIDAAMEKWNNLS